MVQVNYLSGTYSVLKYEALNYGMGEKEITSMKISVSGKMFASG